MEQLKNQIVSLMGDIVYKFSITVSCDRIESYSKELEALAKAYAVLEGKNVIL